MTTSFDMAADGSALEQSAAPMGGVLPSDHGLAAWTYDPLLTRANGVITAGTLYLAGIYLRASVPLIRQLWWINGAGGTTVTASQNWAGLYRWDGILMGSVNVDNKNSVGGKSAILTSPVRNPIPGLYWVALLWNGSNLPSMAKMDPSTFDAYCIGLGAQPGLYRFTANGTRLTALPGSINPANNLNNPTVYPFWAAVSK